MGSLYLAVFQGDAERVEALLNEGEDPNQQATRGTLPIPEALHRRLPHVHQLPASPLELAVLRCDVACAKALMAAGARLQVPKLLTMQQLHDRARACHPELQAEEGNGGGDSPRVLRRVNAFRVRHFSEWEDYFDATWLADDQVAATLDWRDHEAQLLSSTHPDIVELLLRYQGEQLHTCASSSPLAAGQMLERALAVGNDYVTRTMLLARGVSPDAPLPVSGEPPLCVACHYVRPDMVRLLLAVGADPTGAASGLADRATADDDSSAANDNSGAAGCSGGSLGRGDECGRRPLPSCSSPPLPSCSSPPGPLARRQQRQQQHASPYTGQPLEGASWAPLPYAALVLLRVAAWQGWPDLSSAPPPPGRGLLDCLLQIEALVEGGARPPPDLERLLWRHGSLGFQPRDTARRWLVTACVAARSTVWQPELHCPCMPTAFKAAVREFLMCQRRARRASGGASPGGGGQALQRAHPLAQARGRAARGTAAAAAAAGVHGSGDGGSSGGMRWSTPLPTVAEEEAEEAGRNGQVVDGEDREDGNKAQRSSSAIAGPAGAVEGPPHALGGACPPVEHANRSHVDGGGSGVVTGAELSTDVDWMIVQAMAWPLSAWLAPPELPSRGSAAAGGRGAPAASSVRDLPPEHTVLSI